MNPKNHISQKNSRLFCAFFNLVVMKNQNHIFVTVKTILTESLSFEIRLNFPFYLNNLKTMQRCYMYFEELNGKMSFSNYYCPSNTHLR